VFLVLAALALVVPMIPALGRRREAIALDRE
jgi:hypothetical protein